MKNNLDEHVKAYEHQSIFDFDNEIMLNWYPRRVIQLVSNINVVLELGLGHGFSTNIFAEHFKKHLVLEGSQAVINNFKKNFSDCKADIIKTYFEDFKSNLRFDAIIMGFVLEHVSDPAKILNMYKKFLAPSGKVFIAVPNAEVLNRRLGYIAGMLSDMHQLSENDLLLGHKRFYTVNSIAEQIYESGYEIEKMEGIYLKPFTTEQIISLNFDPKIINALCQVGINYPELSCGILAVLKIKNN